MQQVENGRAELEDVKKKAREAAARENIGVEGEVVVLRAKLEELEAENSRLQHRARILNQRYKDGDLVCFSDYYFASALIDLHSRATQKRVLSTL
jgi:predicted nuclease with TOPRIM domain